MMPEIPSEKQATLRLDCPACGRAHTVYACVTGEHVLMCPCGSWIYVEVRDGRVTRVERDSAPAYEVPESTWSRWLDPFRH